jgi:hypothetical protein
VPLFGPTLFEAVAVLASAARNGSRPGSGRRSPGAGPPSHRGPARSHRLPGHPSTPRPTRPRRPPDPERRDEPSGSVARVRANDGVEGTTRGERDRPPTHCRRPERDAREAVVGRALPQRAGQRPEVPLVGVPSDDQIADRHPVRPAPNPRLVLQPASRPQGRIVRVVAREAEGDEGEAVWAHGCRMYADYPGIRTPDRTPADPSDGPRTSTRRLIATVMKHTTARASTALACATTRVPGFVDTGRTTPTFAAASVGP